MRGSTAPQHPRRYRHEEAEIPLRLRRRLAAQNLVERVTEAIPGLGLPVPDRRDRPLPTRGRWRTMGLCRVPGGDRRPEAREPRRDGPLGWHAFRSRRHRLGRACEGRCRSRQSVVTKASHQAQTGKLIAALPESVPRRNSGPTGSGERHQSTVSGYPRPWPYGYRAARPARPIRGHRGTAGAGGDAGCARSSRGKALAVLGAEPIGSSAAELAALLRAEDAKWAAAARAAGLAAE